MPFSSIAYKMDVSKEFWRPFSCIYEICSRFYVLHRYIILFYDCENKNEVHVLYRRNITEYCGNSLNMLPQIGFINYPTLYRTTFIFKKIISLLNNSMLS